MGSVAQKIAYSDAAFLGVERSLTGRRWRTREADLGLVEAFRRRFGLPEIAARLLAGPGTRGSGHLSCGPVTPCLAAATRQSTARAVAPGPNPSNEP